MKFFVLLLALSLSNALFAKSLATVSCVTNFKPDPKPPHYPGTDSMGMYSLNIEIDILETHPLSSDVTLYRHDDEKVLASISVPKQAGMTMTAPPRPTYSFKGPPGGGLLVVADLEEESVVVIYGKTRPEIIRIPFKPEECMFTWVLPEESE